MIRFKTEGFSLIEIIIALLLASLIIALFLDNLSYFNLKTTRIIQTIGAEDHAVAALLMLQHQLESATLTECTTNVNSISNRTSNPTLKLLAPYEIITPESSLASLWQMNKTGRGEMTGNGLLLHQLIETFYTNQLQPSGLIIAPNGFSGVSGDTVVIDDCTKSLITTINQVTTLYGVGKELKLAFFNVSEFHLPFSISLLQNHVYYPGKTMNSGYPAALFRSNGQQREELVPQLSDIQFEQTAKGMKILVVPEYSKNRYYVLY